MSKKYLILNQNINNELGEIGKTVQRAKKAWDLALDRDDSLYLDSVALSLHDFYNGLERIFERIAENVDEFKPNSVNWHQEILKQMTIEIPNVRPVVISHDLKENLDEYRAFRHIVRNIYSHNFRIDKMKNLIENIDKVFNEVENSLQFFSKFLESTQ
jgi:hypothetical protein